MEQEKCSMCKGEGGFEFTLPSGELRKTTCVCDGSGLKIDQLKSDLKTRDIQISQIYKERKLLQDWVLNNNNCKTCDGDQRKTWIGLTCQECGLPGSAPWPG